MTDFKVTESGWYRTRDGRDAEVVVNHNQNCAEPVLGYVVGGSTTRLWNLDGKYYFNHQSCLDLVEYLGKERPKQKKVVRMAPALLKYISGDYRISVWLYESEERAKEAQGGMFIRWLIDTPYAIDVEVPDNG